MMHLGRPAPALLAAVQVPMQHLRPQRPPRLAPVELLCPFLRHLVTFSQKSRGFSGTLFGFHLLGGSEFRLRQDFAAAKCLCRRTPGGCASPSVPLCRPGLSPPGKTKSAQRLQLSLKLLDAGRLVAGRYDMDLDFLVTALAGQHHAIHAATWRILPWQLAAADGTDRPAVFYFDCITVLELFQFVSAPLFLIHTLLQAFLILRFYLIVTSAIPLALDKIM